MTTPTKPVEQKARELRMSDIEKRLRAKHRRYDLETGGGTIGPGGEASSWTNGPVYMLDNPDGPEAADEIARLRAIIAALNTDEERIRREAFEEALTASGDTKAAYHGEFKFDVMVPDIDEDNEELVPMSVPVPWTMVKEIMAAIKARALSTPSKGVG